jgi:hypothetical protein
MTSYYKPEKVVVAANRPKLRIVDRGHLPNPTLRGRIVAFVVGLFIGLVLGLAARQLRLSGFQSSWMVSRTPLSVAMRVSPTRTRTVTRLSYAARHAAGRRRKRRSQPRPKFQERRSSGDTWKT